MLVEKTVRHLQLPLHKGLHVIVLHGPFGLVDIEALGSLDVAIPV